MSNLSLVHYFARPMSLEADDMKIPECCGETMRIDADSGKFVEVICVHCGDRVYLKKSAMQRPQIIDD